jgi:hypothetical protein
MVWRGGETTPCAGPVAVGALPDRPTAPEMAPQSRGRWAAGQRADELAQQRTRHGARSPRRPAVLPHTVQGMRLTRGRMPNRSPSPPRRIAGSRTVPQLAPALAITPPGVEHQITRGPVALTRAAATGLSRFPAAPETREAVRQ